MKTGPTYAFAAAVTLAICVLLAGPSAAQTVDVVETAFKDWMASTRSTAAFWP